MNRVVFRDFRVQVANYSQSVGSPLGTCIDDIPALAGLVNVATERLMFEPTAPDEGWWGAWGRFVFNISTTVPYITLPRGLARIIVMDLCKLPVKVQNGFYEFLDYGRGLQPKDCSVSPFIGCGELTQAYDRETVATLSPLSSVPQTIRVFPTDSSDVAKTVIIQGADQNGNTVLGSDIVTNQPILGETVLLDLPFVNTVNIFSTITGIEKDVTAGPVTFQQVDPASGFAAALSSMEPTETAAAYRRYLVSRLPKNCCDSSNPILQVTAMAKFEYVPVASDPDYLIIPCVPALIAECECLRYESMDNARAASLADKKHTKALSLLFGQLDHYLGKERPAITVPIFGASPLIRQPI